MNKIIFDLDQVNSSDIQFAGGKGANLGEMVQKGFPVPPGFIISTEACRTFFSHIELGREVETLEKTAPSGIRKQCNVVQDKIRHSNMPASLSDTILSAYNDLIKKKGADIICAVRSSATAEDLLGASFAGQHETYYDVREDNLLQMIRHCWASLFSFHATSYRSTQGMDHSSVLMAVVVQEMVISEISGVTFTANPVSGDKDVIVTEACFGMGAAIVDGRVSPDHYVLARKGLKIREKKIVQKRFMVPPSFKGKQDVRLVDVPLKKQFQETLSTEKIGIVTKWAIKAEEAFGTPQDMEWAMGNGQFYVLQSRPITILGREEIRQDDKGKYVLFKPIRENFTDSLLPLTGDLLSGMLPPGVRLVKGYCYIDIRVLKPFLPFDISSQGLADLLYNIDADTTDLKISYRKLPFFLLVLFSGYLILGVFYARTRRLPDDFMDSFKDVCKKFENNSKFGIRKTLRELWAWIWMDFFDPMGKMPITVNLTSLRYIVGLFFLKKQIRKWIPDIREDAEVLLCSGEKGILSADMGRHILNLARIVEQNAPVRQILKKHKPENVLAELKEMKEARDFLSHLNEFLATFGHRGLKELELRSPRWEENPGHVLGMIKNYLLAESDPEAHEEKMNRTRQSLEAEIRQKLEIYPFERLFRVRWWLIKKTADKCKYFSKMRENSRFYHIMAFNSVRKKILEKEACLMEKGKLKCRDDIFYLLLDEIKQLEAGDLGWFDVEETIRDRRLAHIRLSKMIPPKTIGIKTNDLPEMEKELSKNDSILKGQPASPGKYRGHARVIMDPSIDVELKPGEILIAPYTDPAWTPLFLTSGAAVVEVGSYLSHAGTVAREFGMPCVVDAPNCTSLIQTGMEISVDGDSGEVRIM